MLAVSRVDDTFCFSAEYHSGGDAAVSHQFCRDSSQWQRILKHYTYIYIYSYSYKTTHIIIENRNLLSSLRTDTYNTILTDIYIQYFARFSFGLPTPRHRMLPYSTTDGSRCCSFLLDALRSTTSHEEKGVCTASRWYCRWYALWYNTTVATRFWIFFFLAFRVVFLHNNIT